jgi:beta-galactosidase
VFVLPKLSAGSVALDVEVSGSVYQWDRVVCRVTNPAGQQVTQKEYQFPTSGPQKLSLAINVPSPRAWSPDDPALYRVDVQVSQNGQISDGKSIRFGM